MNEKEDETHCWKRRKEDTTKRKKRPERESSGDFHHATMEAFAKEDVDQACNTTFSCLHSKKRSEQESSENIHHRDVENITTRWKISPKGGKYHHEVETSATAPLPPPTAHTAICWSPGFCSELIISSECTSPQSLYRVARPDCLCRPDF